MSSRRLVSLALLLVATAVWNMGCGSNPPSPPKANGGHDHGHEHAHHGPHGGHIVELGEEEYHAEWTHEENGQIDVYLLDSEMKKSVPIPAETIAIDVKIGENEKSYPLAAMNRTEGDTPVASQFQITDKNLLGVLEALSDGVEATLKVNIKDKDYVGKFTKGGHDHGHKH